MSLWFDHQQNRFSQDGTPVWNDYLGQILTKSSGAGTPTWTTGLGGGPFAAYKFNVGDTVQVLFHVNHDIAPGQPIFIHSHWMTDGTNVQPIKWQFQYSIAAGHNTANFNMAGTTVSVQQAAQGTAWRHMISEISTGITDGTNIVVDGLVMVNVSRITNGGTDNTDGVYLLMSDLHIQSQYLGTKNKSPSFYV
jgi:hypothetical protein